MTLRLTAALTTVTNGISSQQKNNHEYYTQNTMQHFSARLTIALSLLAPVNAASAETVDIYPDTWVAIDDLEREMPTYETEPLKTDKDRIVSIFYVTWHHDDYFNKECPSDVTKILQQDPTARFNPWHPLWIERTCHWGEPENGYFLSRDKYVIRKDISMLTDAGVDLLILDCTNGVAYFDEWDTLFEVMNEMKAEGNKVPKVCFWVYNEKPARAANWIFDRYYRPGRHKDYWFYWDGKPLFLYNSQPPENETPEKPDAIYGEDFLNFFTLRNMWWGSTYDFVREEYPMGKDGYWYFGYDMHDPGFRNLGIKKRIGTKNGRNEMMSVTPAQHSSTMVGKTYTIKAGEPTLNQYDLPSKKIIGGKVRNNPEKYGLYFQERWDEALSIDPDLIYLNDWNEWTAGMFCEHTDNFMGRPNDMYFVDQYNAEFNRTIQPMKDGYTDNYYMQMVQNIRRYKGVRQAPKAICRYKMTNPANWDSWENVSEEFLDTRGDVAHRNYNGYGRTHYTNTSGRNDIVSSKVAIDGDNIHFYVSTDQDITPYTDPNWMMLLINSDRDYTTGWYGFDFIINKSVTSAGQTTVQAYNAESKTWQTVAQVPYTVEGKNMVITIPMSQIGLEPGNEGGFYFKWTDNPESLDTPISLCTNGDTAPNRRFCYNYSWNFSQSGIEDTSCAAQTLKATAITPETIYVDTNHPFAVYNLTGIKVAEGDLSTTVNLPHPGLYIVKSGPTSIKISTR